VIVLPKGGAYITRDGLLVTISAMIAALLNIWESLLAPMSDWAIMGWEEKTMEKCWLRPSVSMQR
jgi:hypothetical protein